MAKIRFTLAAGTRGVDCPRSGRLVDVETCWACPSLRRVHAGSIECEPRGRTVAAADLPPA